MNPSRYLQRCLQLAELGGTNVSPNPQVGAVVVYQDRVIGEGYHAHYGGPHAEVMAVSRVKDPKLLQASTLYVSLEPCNHHGKTPPCTDLILHHKIPRVVIGCLDPDPRVSGGGVARLRAHGVEVILAEDSRPFVQLNRSFFINQQLGRPYITLKWAQSANGLIAGLTPDGQDQAVAITHFAANTLVHRFRFRHQAIMVGRRTAAIDNPSLTNRLFYGQHPTRIILDRRISLPADLQVFTDGKAPTLVPNELKEADEEMLRFWRLDPWPDLPSLFERMYKDLGICSVLVEGGAHLLQQLLDAGLYDEVLVLQGMRSIPQGKPAPRLPIGFEFDVQELWGEDLVWHKQMRHFEAVNAERPESSNP